MDENKEVQKKGNHWSLADNIAFVIVISICIGIVLY